MDEYTFYNYMVEVENAHPFGDECKWLAVMRGVYWDNFKAYCLENQLESCF